MPDNSCVDSCSDGYYQETLSTCAACDLSCKTCNAPGDSSSCIACAANKFKDMNTNTCVSSCPLLTYPDS